MTKHASENIQAPSPAVAPRAPRQAGARQASSRMAACPAPAAASSSAPGGTVSSAPSRASGSVGRQRAGRGAGSSSSGAPATSGALGAPGGCGAAKPSRRASASGCGAGSSSSGAAGGAAEGATGGAAGGNGGGAKRRRPGGGRKKLLDALEARLDALTEGLAAALVAEKGIDMVKEIKELYAMLDALRGEGAEKARAARVLVVWGGDGGAAREGEAGPPAADAPAGLEAAAQEGRHD